MAAQQREREDAAERERALRAENPGINQWLVLGPIAYEGTDGVKALDQEQIPAEDRLRPRAGERVKVDQDERVWTATRLDDSHIDFHQLIGQPSDYRLAYAVCYIVSGTNQSGLIIKVGSDDQAKVFLNGRGIYRQAEGRAWERDKGQVTGVELKAGINVLVFKVVN